MRPRWRQNGPRWRQDGAKIAQDGAKMGQDGAKTGHNGAKTGHDWPRRPKMAPRRSRLGARGAQACSTKQTEEKRWHSDKETNAREQREGKRRGQHVFRRFSFQRASRSLLDTGFF